MDSNPWPSDSLRLAILLSYPSFSLDSRGRWWTRIFLFSIIFSRKQHLRLLGYCAPQMSCPSLASNWPVTSAGPLTTSKATNMTTQSTIRAAVQLLHVAAFTFPETVSALSLFLASLFAMCQLAKWEVTLRPHKLSYSAWPRVLLRCCHCHNIHFRLEWRMFENFFKKIAIIVFPAASFFAITFPVN